MSTPELFDTTGVGDDDAHWDALASRVASGALAVRRADRFASSPALWTVACVAFVSALVVVMSSSTAAPARDDAELRAALAPADDVGRALALRAAPPAIGVLVFEPPVERAR